MLRLLPAFFPVHHSAYHRHDKQRHLFKFRLGCLLCPNGVAQPSTTTLCTDHVYSYTRARQDATEATTYDMFHWNHTDKSYNICVSYYMNRDANPEDKEQEIARVLGYTRKEI